MSVIQLNYTTYRGYRLIRGRDGKVEVRGPRSTILYYVARDEDEARRWIDEQFGNGGPEAA